MALVSTAAAAAAAATELTIQAARAVFTHTVDAKIGEQGDVFMFM